MRAAYCNISETAAASFMPKAVVQDRSGSARNVERFLSTDVVCVWFCQVAQRGLTWSSLHESVTPDFPFSAARVFIMISIDVVLYAVLALYLDKVRYPEQRWSCSECLLATRHVHMVFWTTLHPVLDSTRYKQVCCRLFTHKFCQSSS